MLVAPRREVPGKESTPAANKAAGVNPRKRALTAKGLVGVCASAGLSPLRRLDGKKRPDEPTDLKAGFEQYFSRFSDAVAERKSCAGSAYQ
jgi:hypothetical protein